MGQPLQKSNVPLGTKIRRVRMMGFSPMMLLILALLCQATPQNPSPMSDTTRPHPRIAQYEPRGHRWPLSTGTLYVPEGFKDARRVPLIVHFHGAPWLVEHHVRTRLRGSVLVTVQLGSGSRVYADAFADPSRFAHLLADAAARLAEFTHHPVAWHDVTLSSFSAGYGASRSILAHPEHFALVSRVVLADSLHASYAGDASGPRTADPAVDETTLEPFITFAMEAAAGRKHMRVSHSEVFPGTYASTTETANVLLRRLSVPRQRVVRDGPIGMQQLSEARRGNFHLAGFAGNSAPDHLDHLYALDRLLAGR